MDAKESSSDAPEFTELNDLASELVGGKIVFATDDWFAAAENLLKASDPEWRETAFTEYGKWMDGWETRRKRSPGHDWCIIQLGVGGVISGFEVDTAFFTGNYAPRVSIQAACLTQPPPAREGDRIGTKPTQEELDDALKLDSQSWTTLVPMTTMGAGYQASRHNFLPVDSPHRWTHLRLNLFPDGGVARLRVYGKVKPDWSKIPQSQVLDLLALENGGECVDFSNAHYGHARNLTMPGRAKIMAEGWETARRLDRPPVLELDGLVLKVPGNEWCEFKLGHTGVIQKIEIDTNHFKGNYPDSCYIEGCLNKEGGEKSWQVLLPAQKMAAHHQHYYSGEELRDIGPVSHVRVTIAPDGGLSRVRLWGQKTGN